jgi:transposase-like protein
MYIINQLEDFSTEAKCIAHFKQIREQEGVYCKKCNKNNHYWLSGKLMWQCKNCKFRTSLKSGSIMEHSKMTFRKWYRVMIMMSATKKGFSAKEMQKQLEANRYESTWNMMHKIRKAMGLRDTAYSLKDQVEIDEGYFTVETTADLKKGQKRGRGSVTTVPVSIIVEATRLEDLETGAISTKCGHVKMQLIEDHKAQTIDKVIQDNLDPSSIAFTDCSKSYTHLSDILDGHEATKSSDETTRNELKWVHTVISNAKRVFNGIHHKLNKDYIQNYLDEFCYKFNRRNFKGKLFDRLLVAVSQSTRKH